MDSFANVTFSPIPHRQAEFLADRHARVVPLFAPYDELRNCLLGLAGLEVVLPPYDEYTPAEQARQRVEVPDVLARGTTWPGQEAVCRAMDANNCHTNVAMLFKAREANIATGWALAEDGLWREHSWGLTLEHAPRVVETTKAWLLYYGYHLTPFEARRFVRAEFGPQSMPEGAA